MDLFTSTEAYDPTEADWGKTLDIAEGPNHGIDGDSFAGRKPAWHKLGTVYDPAEHGALSALKILQLANADYPVFTAPVIAKAEAPYQPGSDLMVWKTAVDPNLVNFCRLHPKTGELQIIGQGSKTKQTWDNKTIFVEFADKLIDVAEPTVSTCGVTRGGRSAFMCFKLPEGLLIGGEDAVELWMTAYTSYDSKAPTQLIAAPLRTVCQNTLNYNLAHAVSRYVVKRTANAKLNLQQAREMLKMTYAYAERIKAVGNALVAQPMNANQFDTLVTKLWGPGDDATKLAQTKWTQRFDKLHALFTEAGTQAGIRNTAWGAVQAVTEFCDWEAKVDAKVAQRWQENGGADGYRFWRSMTGEKSVTKPKDDILDAVLEVFGVTV
jgi:phage/plasmid-like protein (TIGR03299 family)